MVRFAVAGLLCFCGVIAGLLAPQHGAHSEAERPLLAPVSIDVQARPIEWFLPRDRSRVRFGALEFRSGLVLTSPYRHFGGLSALHLDARGEHFVSLSDRARWFTGRIVYDGKTMTGLADVKAAPMLGADGRPLTAKGWYDTESLAIDGPISYVGIERTQRIVRFDFGRDGVTSRGEDTVVPPALRKLPSNKGIEALVMIPKGLPLQGTLVAISERGLDSSGNILGFLIGGATPGQFTIRRRDDFDISDAALLPSGDLLLLERKFSWITGVAIRIRRIPLAMVHPDALIDGPEIFHADLTYNVDNMEGLAVHRDADGKVVLTLVSDDNFSILQRTLLLQFTLVEP
jgi:hypothetical protein